MRERLTASQVLDVHGRLREHLTEPETAAHLINILPGCMNMDRPFTHQPFFPASTAAEALGLLRADLAAARTYQVSSDIVASVTSAWSEYSDGGAWLREEDAPLPAGFAWLDTPVPMVDGDVLVRRALSWAPRDLLLDGGRLLRGVRVMAWHHTGDLDDAWTPQDRGKWLHEHGGRHRLTLDGAEFAALGEPVPCDGPAAWLHALWTALAAGIPATSRPGIRKESRKRFARRGGSPPEVTVVSLRQPQPATAHDNEPAHDDHDTQTVASAGPGGLNWPGGGPPVARRDYRSEVDAHHRHVEPYEVPVHKPSPAQVGDGTTCTVCGKRLTPVIEHIRGPEDKPLRPRPRRLYRA